MGFLTVCALACAAPPAPDRAGSGDIVLVVMDTLRRDHTGVAGSSESHTPNLDALADGNSLYAKAWATAPWTVPSHASMFTGRLPSGHGCTSRRPRFVPEVPTLATSLAEAGWSTAAFYSNPWLTDEVSGLLVGFQEQFVSPADGPDGDQGGRETVLALRNWLEERSDERPAFLFVNLLEAHSPFDPPAEVRRNHEALEEAGRIDETWILEVQSGLRHPGPEDWERLRALYAGDVLAADRFLGQILELVGEDATVLVTSDHGEHLGELGAVEHQFRLDEVLLSVPLVVRAPGRIAPGRIDRPVLLTDLYATVLDLAGVRMSQLPPHSRSLLEPPGQEHGTERPLVAEYAGAPGVLLEHLQTLRRDFDVEGHARALESLRLGRWRWTVDDRGSGRLLDLDDDSESPVDVTDSHPDVARALAVELQRLIEEAARTGQAGGDLPPLDEEIRERLRSLGYVR